MSEDNAPRLPDIETSLLQQLYHYWVDRRGGRLHPARADIDPVDIPRLLPYIMLVDVLDDGQRFRFRLVGTRIAMGADPTGRFLHETVSPGLYGHHVMALYGKAAKSARPLYSVFDYKFEDRRVPGRIHRLFLPLSDDGANVNMMLIGQVAESARAVERSVWRSPPSEFREHRLVFLDPDRPAGPAQRAGCR